MRKLKLTAVMFSIWFALMPILSVWADEASEKMAEYNSVQQQMRQAEAQKEQAARRAQRASGQMQEVVTQMEDLRQSMQSIEARQQDLEVLVTANREDLKEKKAMLVKRTKIFHKRLRDIYINGQINYLDVLLGAKDFSDFSSRVFLLQKIISRDMSMLEAIRTAAAEVDSRQKNLDAQLIEIENLKQDNIERQKETEAMKEERANLLYKAEEERRSSEQEYDRLQAISENIASMLRNMEGAGVLQGNGTGKMMWPVSGEITSYYGWRTHPIFGTTRYHSGYDIACDTGTPIVAADSGTIIYSGWMGGYGYAIMIDHGNGLVSIYGHNSELAVSEGQHVAQGQLVAYAGSTGWSTGPHCHFEVRLHGEVTDPMNYLQ